MSPKAYALILLTAAASVFGGVVATNVIIDAQGVFQTGLIPIQHPNQRYQRFSAYQQAEDRFDGVVFGSSRAQMIPRDVLSAQLGGVRFADFAVPAGLLDDHLPVLEYMLRPNAPQRPRLRTIFLMIDIDNFGNAPITNRFHNSWLAPTLTGESTIGWWWRHLTALQFGRWRDQLKAARLMREAGEEPKAQVRAAEVREQVQAAEVRENVPTPALLLQPAGAASETREQITSRLEFGRQLQLLERMALLCGEHGITLVVAISPMHPDTESRFDPADMARAVRAVTRIVPVWDFSRTTSITGRPELWYRDKLHFAPEIAAMMMRRLGSEAMPPGWEQFGRLRQHEARCDACD